MTTEGYVESILPPNILWFKPDRSKAINIIRQVFKVPTVCVPDTDTCTGKGYISSV